MMSLEEARWQALRRRDPAADDDFVYSVRTTGVYCRPSCAARPARPENLRFHATPAEAEAAGFRPCKRCRPNETRPLLHYALGRGSLGLVLAAMGERGLRALLLGEEPAALLQDLRRRFPGARLREIAADEAPWFGRVRRFLEAPGEGLELPLDPAGTAFQRRVWQALAAIPAGRTASYAEVASAIGMPRAVRAVAQACGANALAVAIPCHRVLRSDGTLSGYRWGAERKRLLLARESTA